MNATITPPQIAPEFSIPSWLESLGLARHASAFAQNGITPEALLSLKDSDLARCGIGPAADRKLILQAIDQLKAGAARSPGAAPRVPSARAGAVAKRPLFDRFGGRFLYISIIAHVVFGLLAAWYVVQRIEAKRKQTFLPGPKGTPGASVNHKVQVQKTKNRMSAPASAKRITTNAVSARVAIPQMQMPTSSAVIPGRMEGSGGAGFALGTMTMGGGGGGGGGGAAMPFFGLRAGGAGLEGTFYDFKMTPEGKDSGTRFSMEAYKALIKSFTSGNWGPKGQPHFTSSTRLYCKYFVFPAIGDTEAGKAFQSPNSGPGGWLAHYKGRVSAPETAEYRFVAWGDNVMILKVGEKIVLDASDVHFLGTPREQVGAVNFPKKNGTPMFAGEWFQLSTIEAKQVEIILGDQGGIFCAGACLQKKGQAIRIGPNGLPELPVFAVAPLSEQDKKALREYLPASMLNGPSMISKAGLFGR